MYSLISFVTIENDSPYFLKQKNIVTLHIRRQFGFGKTYRKLVFQKGWRIFWQVKCLVRKHGSVIFFTF